MAVSSESIYNNEVKHPSFQILSNEERPKGSLAVRRPAEHTDTQISPNTARTV